MALYRTPRRYYLHKRKWSLARGLDTAAQWRGNQDSEPGTALAATFPALAKLATAGYTTVEDLDGADTQELTDPVATGAGLTRREAAAVLEALAPLL